MPAPPPESMVSALDGPGPAVEPVFPSDFDRVVGLLSQLDPTRFPDRWRPIFDFGWRRPDEPVGLMVRSGDRVVGYMGTILSEQIVEGRPERFCNVTSWVAGDSERGVGALLGLALARFQGYTVTSFTPNRLTTPILARLGLRVLDEHWTVLCPTWPTRRAARCRVVTDQEGAALLDPEDARILDDHRPYACHLVATGDHGACLVVYTLRRRWRLRAARLHYLSNRKAFPGYWPAIRRSLVARHRAWLAEADSRLLSGLHLSGAVRKRMGMPRLFRSALQPEQVTDLYSEVILLGVI